VKPFYCYTHSDFQKLLDSITLKAIATEVLSHAHAVESSQPNHENTVRLVERLVLASKKLAVETSALLRVFPGREG
jgi:hypothetical protein